MHAKFEKTADVLRQELDAGRSKNSSVDRFLSERAAGRVAQFRSRGATPAFG